MTTLFYTHPSALAHDPGPGHPEGPVRMRVILDAVAKADLAGLEQREAPPATLAQIARVHPEPYANDLLGMVPAEGYARVDGDTVLSPGSGEAALRAAGAACAAVDAVMAGEARNAFCAMRPPGHHAEPDRAMGFCLFDSVAIAAMQARHVHGIGRIAIVDFDVHHGNGTQAAFWDDPQTLYVSTHQWPLYPGTGAASERGRFDNILNVPLPSATDGVVYRRLFTESVRSRLDAFRPELVLVSAGFDAHATDPLASLALLEDDFAWITRQLVDVAAIHARGRLVSVLEGGYNPPALAASVIAHLRVLLAA